MTKLRQAQVSLTILWEGIMKDVVVLIGAGAIGLALARRVSAGKHLILADLQEETATTAVQTLLDSGYEASAASVDVTSHPSVKALVTQAKAIGEISGVIHAAGVPPSKSSPETILKVDLYGTALVLEEFGKEIADSGSCVVISSQAGHKLPPIGPEESQLLATMPVDDLLELPILQTNNIKNSYHAYQIAKKGCSLRVMAEAVRWGKRGARVNTISLGVITSSMADSELSGERGEDYRNMIENCPAKRAGSPDEVAAMGAFLMGSDGAFITGSDILIDGGMTASYYYGDAASAEQNQ